MRVLAAVLTMIILCIVYAGFCQAVGWRHGGGAIPMVLFLGLLGATWRAITRPPESLAKAAGTPLSSANSEATIEAPRSVPTCQRCGNENRKEARFCAQCGGSLIQVSADSPATRIAATASPSLLRAERSNLPQPTISIIWFILLLVAAVVIIYGVAILAPSMPGPTSSRGYSARAVSPSSARISTDQSTPVEVSFAEALTPSSIPQLGRMRALSTSIVKRYCGRLRQMSLMYRSASWS